MSVMRLHDAVADGKAQAQTGAQWLGRDKGGKERLQDVRGNARPCIFDENSDHAAFFFHRDGHSFGGGLEHGIFGV